jgi:hypothetical protein
VLHDLSTMLSRGRPSVKREDSGSHTAPRFQQLAERALAVAYMAALSSEDDGTTTKQLDQLINLARSVSLAACWDLIQSWMCFSCSRLPLLWVCLRCWHVLVNTAGSIPSRARLMSVPLACQGDIALQVFVRDQVSYCPELEKQEGLPVLARMMIGQLRQGGLG